MKKSKTHFRTFKYRLYPTHAQEQNLFRVIECARGLYNMALAERKYAYQCEGRRVNNDELEDMAKRYRETMPYGQQLFSQTAQSVIKQVDTAYQNFFRSVKRNGRGKGYPRFKGRNRFRSFLFKQYGSGAKIDGRRLKLFGIGRVAVRWHRPLLGVIKTVRIMLESGKWYVCFVTVPHGYVPLPEEGRMIGIDVGVSSLLTTSDGDKIANPNFYRVGQARLRVLQRRLARAQRDSNNYRKALQHVQRQQTHVAHQRRDFLHKLSTALVQEYDCIALEDLQIRNMVRNHHLSKSILDSGWGIFKELLTYKAESAGRKLVLVNPAHTSDTCSRDGIRFENFSLATRRVTCECGLSLDRDHNAALNILRRAGWDTSVPGNVIPLWVSPIDS